MAGGACSHSRVLGCSGDLVTGLTGLAVAYYAGLLGIPGGRTKSTDHPSSGFSGTL